ncbi:MAG: hypothetical protein FJ265_13905 [Planctomycetes bacterium]|nr:hypothetical protein [Planctomycetota bacterium]
MTASVVDPVSAPAAARRWRDFLPGLLLAVGLLLLIQQRTVGVPNEYDRYPDLADQLLRGEVVSDRFHPFGYPLLIAAVQVVARADAWTAGLLVSALSALGLVWAVGRLAEALRPGAGCAARWLAAANAFVWTYGSTACSDLVAAALPVLALALLVRPAPWSWLRLAGGGLLLGASVGVRYAALPTALAIAAWALCRRPRLAGAAALALGLALGYLPHGALNTVATGSPFANDNWQNVYLKVRCGGDAERLEAARAAGTLPGPLAFVRESAGEILRGAAVELERAGRDTLPGLVLGVEQPPPWARWWPFAAAAAALLALARDRRTALLLAGLAALHGAAVGASFFVNSRVLLPALPVAVLGPALALRAAAERSRAAWLLVAAAVAGLAALGQATVREHLASEPVREVEVARELPGRLRAPIAVFTSFLLLDQHVAYPCRFLHSSRLGDRAATWRGLRERMLRCGADVLLLGRRTAPAVFAEVRGGEPPDDFRILHEDGDVFAAELIAAPSDWIVDLTVVPARVADGSPCEITVRLAAVADRARIAAVGVALQPPAGDQLLLDLPAANGDFRRTITPPGPGTFVLQAVVLLHDGQVLRGPRAEIAVGPPDGGARAR